VTAFFVFLILVFGVTAPGLAQSPFYQGKSIRLIVGSSAGGAQDLWARFMGQHYGKHIPGNPEVIVQNMPGAGTMISANHIYNVAKPDGLTLGMFMPSLYIDQLTGQKEVKFEWSKFTWIGSPEPISQVLFSRQDTPYKTLDDIIKASSPARCAATGRATAGHFFPKLIEEALGAKFTMVVGYGGGGDMDLAIEKGEVHCRAGTVSAFVVREPTRTWYKNNYVRPLVQSGLTRDKRLPDVPTIYELMEKHKTPDATRRVAKVMLTSGDLGRPVAAGPGLPAERLKILREAFVKMVNDEAFAADAKKRGLEPDLLKGEELEAIAKDVIVQPPEVVERVKNIITQK
jgi:tripartite-type tricarboxylate transporter receptor subunit TctC